MFDQIEKSLEYKFLYQTKLDQINMKNLTDTKLDAVNLNISKVEICDIL